MPIQFDSVAQLANPATAALLALMLILPMAYFAYRLPVWRPAIHEEVYLRTIGMLAEVFVAVGLIGLVTFVGRAKLDNNGIERAEATRTAERALSEKFSELAQQHCFYGERQNAPTVAVATVRDGCALWRDYSGIYKEDLDWRRAHEEFGALAVRSPIEPRLGTLLQEIAQSIAALISARHEQALVPLERRIITAGISWVFILACASSAAVGVALKCAKAARELRKERQRANPSVKRTA